MSLDQSDLAQLPSQSSESVSSDPLQASVAQDPLLAVPKPALAPAKPKRPDVTPDPKLIKEHFASVDVGRFKSKTVRARPAGDANAVGRVSNDATVRLKGDSRDVDGETWLKIMAIDKATNKVVEGWLEENRTKGAAHLEHQRITAEALIPKGTMPKPEDVKQGKVGDCFLLSALMAVAKSSPAKIVEMFDPDPSDTSSDTVSVRFYRIDKDDHSKLTEEWVTVNKSIAKYKSDDDSDPSSLNGQQRFHKGANWASIIEKAFAVWGGATSHLGPGSINSYEGQSSSLEGGHGETALAQITGEPHEKVALGPLAQSLEDAPVLSKKYSPEQIKLHERMIGELAGGGAMTLGTPQNWDDTILKDAPSSESGASGEAVKGGMASKHVYAVIAATTKQDGQRVVVVRNPWGNTGTEYTKNLFGKFKGFKQVSDAESEIDLADVPRMFERLGARPPK
jgi:hypothetical protein